MKKILLLFLLFSAASVAFAQSAKVNPPQPKKNREIQQMSTQLPNNTSVPPAQNPFGLPSIKRKPLPSLTPFSGTQAPDVRTTRGENGLPIIFEGKTEASADIADLKTGALNYLSSLRPIGIAEPSTEFVAKRIETDELGYSHIRLEQVFQGVPVFGGEVIAHVRKGTFDLLNGRYFPTPQLASVVPNLDADRAIDQVKQHIGPDKVKNNWTAAELRLFKIEPFKAQLVVYHHDSQLDNERLAWYVEAYPNLLRRVVYFVDANTGEVIHHYDYTCNISGHEGCGEKHDEDANAQNSAPLPSDANTNDIQNETAPPPPVTGNGTDLLGTSRSFGAWQQGSAYYLEDASKMMFNSGASTMPSDPVGVIVTLDALNKSPENDNFDYTIFTSNGLNFSNSSSSNGAKAVSAHFNSIQSYDYFQNTHGRKSIDGDGGNILAFVNVAEGNGTSMENAYWNGAAMWYGNGGSTFRPLARGLDVGGHEMTHGVVEKTANLVYQDESGALNESFADIFGVMIDPNDWKVGEDVMQNGASPNGCLRDLSNPPNGDTPGGGNNFGGNFWQPKHVNQQYTGSDDNGGVHKNSGIPNHAFYLFATNAAVGNAKAEKVYYKALRDYLVKSSKFIDCRIAVIQAANDLYGSTVANAAAAAFTAVGIGNQSGGNYLGQLPVNPGSDIILCVTNNSQNIDVALSNGQILGSIYTQGVKSRPSVTDNGSQVVFVNKAGFITTIDLNYNGGNVNFIVNPPFSPTGVWRNAVISKDGRYIAAVTTVADNLIYVVDLISGLQEEFELYNPTYTTGQITGEVQYADVLEFDYSGEYIMYDAYNELSSTQSGDISYWDIGFLQFWENGAYASPSDAFISKLFSGLPEKISIGNPTIAKNSPYIIAFDLIDDLNSQYDIYGANVETGDYNTIREDNGSLGWPNFNRLDNALIYQGPDQGDTNIYIRPLAADKISPAGNEGFLLADREWGVWYANGNRSLQVDTDEPANAIALFAVAVAPNPVLDMARLTIASKIAADVQISIVNLLGTTMQTRTVQLAEGENQFDLNMGNMPSGTYIVRLFSGKSGAAIKVIKQ